MWDNDKGSYVSIGTHPTEKEAKLAELKFEAGLEVPRSNEPRRVPKGREKFGAFALEVIQSRKHLLSPSTYHFHLWNLKAHLSALENVAIAVLWGKDAEGLRPRLGETPVVASAHPSPLSARRGFFGSRPFSRVNDLLVQQGAAPIDWTVADDADDAETLFALPG